MNHSCLCAGSDMLHVLSQVITSQFRFLILTPWHSRFNCIASLLVKLDGEIAVFYTLINYIPLHMIFISECTHHAGHPIGLSIRPGTGIGRQGKIGGTVQTPRPWL
jgi:hypothetical protein